MIETTKQDVSDLLENFADYVNPDGRDDPWFRVGEINQQFAWDDIDEDELTRWLEELTEDGALEEGTEDGERAWRWLS